MTQFPNAEVHDEEISHGVFFRIDRVDIAVKYPNPTLGGQSEASFSRTDSGTVIPFARISATNF